MCITKTDTQSPHLRMLRIKRNKEMEAQQRNESMNQPIISEDRVANREAPPSPSTRELLATTSSFISFKVQNAVHRFSSSLKLNCQQLHEPSKLGTHRKSLRHYCNSTLAIFILLLAVLESSEAAPHKCVLPSSWRGEWFHSGVQSPVLVNEMSISHKGECVHSVRDRYLFRNSRYGCYRCLVIHQKHDNVLQYKETYCDRSNSLEDVCGLLAGDAQLHSMFRLGAKPVTCPFPHTYTFTYNRGHGECAFPKSTVFSCTEDWRLLFRYQACPDVQGTESTTEELVCLAAWKEGSNRYMVGKSDHPLATSDEDRYRCFVYDSWEHKNDSGFQVAQSGDATCNGLFSVNDGSRTLRLTKVDTSGTRCRFPSWAGGTHWHSLDGGTSLHVTRHNSTIRLSGHSVSGGPATLGCLTPESNTQNSATYVTRVTHGCNSGYQCVYLLQRDTHVLEVIMGKVTLQLDEACSTHFFNKSSTNFTTFISGTPESRNCPGVGRYEVLAGNSPVVGGFSPGGREGGGLPLETCKEELLTALTVGCSSRHTLEIHTSCSLSEYKCHGWWEEAGRQYLVVTPISRASNGARRLCLVLDRGAGALSLASSAHSCSREMNPSLQGRITLNNTSSGGCEALTASGSTSSAPTNLVPSMTLLMTSSIFMTSPIINVILSLVADFASYRRR